MVGFRFKTEQALDPRHSDISRLLGSDRDIKVIHLQRRSLLDQYISHQVVLRQTRVNLLKIGEPAPEVASFRVDVGEAIQYFLRLLQREERIAEMYVQHRQAIVVYEDLARDDHPIRDALQAFLGVTPLPLSTPTLKILPRNTDLVLNLDEVLDAMERSGLSGRAIAETA